MNENELSKKNFHWERWKLKFIENFAHTKDFLSSEKK